MQETDSAEATAGILIRVVNPKWKFRIRARSRLGGPLRRIPPLVLLCYKVDTSRLFGLAEDIVA